MKHLIIKDNIVLSIEERQFPITPDWTWEAVANSVRVKQHDIRNPNGTFSENPVKPTPPPPTEEEQMRLDLDTVMAEVKTLKAAR